MADWWDIFSDISDAGLGIAKGLDAGMAPLKTWEGIRTTDLQNDRYETENQNQAEYQRARMGEQVTPFYGDWLGAQTSTFRDTTAKNENDIFTQNQKLALGKMFSDADGAFQQDARARGLTPGMAGYNALAQEYYGRIDPMGAIRESGTFNVDALRDRGTGDQASLAVAQGVLRKRLNDPTLTVERDANGKMWVNSARGREEVTDPDALLKAASMYYQPGSPEGAIRQGIIDAGNVAKVDAELWKAYTGGTATKGQENELRQQLTQTRVLLGQQINDLRAEETKAINEAKNQFLDEAQTAAKLAPIRAQIEQKRQQQNMVGDRLMYMNAAGSQQVLPPGGVPQIGGPNIQPGQGMWRGQPTTQLFAQPQGQPGQQPGPGRQGGGGGGGGGNRNAANAMGGGGPKSAAASPAGTQVAAGPGNGGEFSYVPGSPTNQRQASPEAQSQQNQRWMDNMPEWMQGLMGAGSGRTYNAYRANPSSYTSNMTPEQQMAFLEMIAPSIAAAQQRPAMGGSRMMPQPGGGQPFGPNSMDPQTYAMLQSMGII